MKKTPTKMDLEKKILTNQVIFLDIAFLTEWTT